MTANYTRSEALYARAACIPGRSNTRSKAPGKFADVGAGPLYGLAGHGALVRDADGNEYIDMLCGLGAVSLGYGVTRASSATGVYSLPHVNEVLVSEAILEAVAPWATHVKMTRTGTEALAGAVWMARRATGRRPVFVAEGSYHGWLPWTTERGQVGSDGEWTHEYRYGWCGAIAQLVDIYGLPAAIIVEPARWQETPQGYLATLQQDAQRLGALFIVDEMIYGGRWALGGATEINRLKPDLACYGKAFGNGRPVAFLVGRDALATHGGLISGTYSGDASCLDTLSYVLQRYRAEPIIETLWARGTQLGDGLRAAIADAGAPVRADGVAPVHGRLLFHSGAAMTAFSTGMAQRGVLWSPDCQNVCAAHTPAQIAAVVDMAYATMRELPCAS